MIKFKDLDKSKYYFVNIANYKQSDAIKHTQGTFTIEPQKIYVIYDVLRDGLFEVNEQQMKYMYGCNDIVIIESGVDPDEEGIIVWVARTDGINCNVLQLTNDGYVFKRGEARDKLAHHSHFITDFTIDMSETLNVAACKLLAFEGMEYREDGKCIIREIERDRICIPEGVVELDILECEIVELVVSSTCKRVYMSETQIVDLYAENTFAFTFEHSAVTNMYVSSNTRYLDEGIIEHLYGMPSLLDIYNESICLEYVDLLDLTGSMCSNGIVSLDGVEGLKVILPKNVNKLHLKNCNIHSVICKGHIDEVYLIGSHDTNIILENGAEKEARKQIEKHRITFSAVD